MMCEHSTVPRRSCLHILHGEEEEESGAKARSGKRL
jgi:hypothetical protein